jgi:hypothetical protein
MKLEKLKPRVVAAMRELTDSDTVTNLGVAAVTTIMECTPEQINNRAKLSTG